MEFMNVATRHRLPFGYYPTGNPRIFPDLLEGESNIPQYAEAQAFMRQAYQEEKARVLAGIASDKQRAHGMSVNAQRQRQREADGRLNSGGYKMFDTVGLGFQELLDINEGRMTGFGLTGGFVEIPERDRQEIIQQRIKSLEAQDQIAELADPNADTEMSELNQIQESKDRVNVALRTINSQLAGGLIDRSILNMLMMVASELIEYGYAYGLQTLASIKTQIQDEPGLFDQGKLLSAYQLSVDSAEAGVVPPGVSATIKAISKLATEILTQIINKLMSDDFQSMNVEDRKMASVAIGQTFNEQVLSLSESVEDFPVLRAEDDKIKRLQTLKQGVEKIQERLNGVADSERDRVSSDPIYRYVLTKEIAELDRNLNDEDINEAYIELKQLYHSIREDIVDRDIEWEGGVPAAQLEAPIEEVEAEAASEQSRVAGEPMELVAPAAALPPPPPGREPARRRTLEEMEEAFARLGEPEQAQAQPAPVEPVAPAQAAPGERTLPNGEPLKRRSEIRGMSKQMLRQEAIRVGFPPQMVNQLNRVQLDRLMMTGLPPDVVGEGGSKKSGYVAALIKGKFKGFDPSKVSSPSKNILKMKIKKETQKEREAKERREEQKKRDEYRQNYYRKMLELIVSGYFRESPSKERRDFYEFFYGQTSSTDPVIRQIINEAFEKNQTEMSYFIKLYHKWIKKNRPAKYVKEILDRMDEFKGFGKSESSEMDLKGFGARLGMMAKFV